MIELRAARAEDEPEILALFGDCFGHELRSEEWQWKYLSAPHGSASWVAEAEGRIVAHYGGIRQACRAAGSPFVGYQGVDIMTHPAWRARFFGRRGILVRLAEDFFAARPMDAFFGFPSERHARLNRLLLGYEEHRWVARLERECGTLVAAAARDQDRVETGWSGLEATEVDRLWQACREELALTLEKDSRYLFWRYRERPGEPYEALAARGWWGRLEGLAVVGTEGEEVRVFDLLACSEKVEERLFAAAARFGEERGARTLVVWANPQEALYRRLAARGFVEERGIPCTVKLFAGFPAAIPFLDAYCYRLGDYDAV